MHVMSEKHVNCGHSVEMIKLCILLKDCSLLFLHSQATKLFEEPAVHPSAVISEKCQVSRHSVSSVRATFMSISVPTCSVITMNETTHNASVRVSVCVSRWDQTASSERRARSPIRRP